MTNIIINRKKFTQKGPLYFIADIGANHDGDINRALKLIELAKEAGADAAKFQNFKAGTIVSRKGFENTGQLSHQAAWKKPVYEVYEDASIPQEWTAALKEKCDEVCIDYFTSPYDKGSVDHVDKYVDLYKIGSGDITWLNIIEFIAKKNKPVLLATGASDLNDVQRAMNTLIKHTNKIVLMQCNTNYTGSSENFKHINLNVLKTFAALYPDVILGLSDHTPGHATVLGAIALGATFIEKHFTEDNSRTGPDHKFAMNPVTWRAMVDKSNELFLALGDGIKRVEANEEKTVLVQRRALRYTSDLSKGHRISDKDIFPLRPYVAEGLHPYQENEVIGKKLVANVTADELVTAQDVE
jgi:sialic acid synthase SpsE